tara:strand:+ start:343 stop:807 length:465 start_codon:yes stop_codon:yes gene_type:complete
MAKKEFKNSKELKKAILKDWEDQSEAHLSQFINSVASDLASKEVSPVKTGFFASSWQVSKTRMPPDNQEKIKPWIGNRDYIAPRFKVPTRYKFNQPIYIGNRAKYTEKALMSPKSNVGAYILNGSGTFKEGLRQKVDRIFTDKRPNINIEGLDV